LFLIVPLEIFDIYLAHIWIPKALQGRDPEGAMDYFDRWLVCGGTLVIGAATAVIVLAIFRPL